MISIIHVIASLVIRLFKKKAVEAVLPEEPAIKDDEDDK